MNALLQRFTALDPRMARLIVGAVCFLVLFESWVVLRAPITELRSISTTKQQLQSTVANDRVIATELERLTREVDEIERRIASAGTGGTGDDARVPLLITALDSSAKRQGISLGSVRTPTLRPMAGFEEIGYGVEARGEYRPLFEWLREVSQQADPLVVAGLTFKSIDEGQRIALTLRLAAYRPTGAAP